MPERLECEVLQKARYINTLTFTFTATSLAEVAKVYLHKLQSVQNMAARVVSGVRRSEHINPVLKDLHWLPFTQRVVLKTALMVWKCVHVVVPAYLSDLSVPATAISGRQHLRSAATGTVVPRDPTATAQRSFAVNGPATWNRLPPCSTTVTGPVGERLQAGTEDAPVLDRPAPLRRLHDSGAGYEYPDFC